VYNEQWQDAYSATRRVPAAPPSSGPDPVAQLKEIASLHRDGALTDAEFADAKRKVLEQDPAS
jgi:hypothetical protein